MLTVDFAVCTLAVKKKKIRAGFDMSDRTISLSLLLKELFIVSSTKSEGMVMGDKGISQIFTILHSFTQEI
jgi:hypothetical protein